MASLIPSASASGTGSMTLAGPSTNSNQTVNIPDTTGTMMVSGNMPAFSFYQNSGQSLSASTATKLLVQASEYDTTSGMFASSRFTPTVGGYYIFNCAWQAATVASDLRIYLYKNGGALIKNISISSNGTLNWVSGSGMMYLNGSTDYAEIYVYSSLANTTNPTQQSTWFQGALIRSA